MFRLSFTRTLPPLHTGVLTQSASDALPNDRSLPVQPKLTGQTGLPGPTSLSVHAATLARPARDEAFDPTQHMADEHAAELRLVGAARAGDRQAWASLYQNNHPRLVRHLMYMVGDADLAREFAQETFAQALLSLPRFAEKSRFLTWLCAIGNNLARKHWRTQSRRAHAYERLQQAPPSRGPHSDPEAVHLGQRRADALWAVLETLPESLREAFVLVDLQDLPVAQAAAQLGITPESLAMRCSRARAKIRDALRERGWLQPGESKP